MADKVNGNHSNLVVVSPSPEHSRYILCKWIEGDFGWLNISQVCPTNGIKLLFVMTIFSIKFNAISNDVRNWLILKINFYFTECVRTFVAERASSLMSILTDSSYFFSTSPTVHRYLAPTAMKAQIQICFSSWEFIAEQQIFSERRESMQDTIRHHPIVVYIIHAYI